MPGKVIIATIMRPHGDTGVQTHFNQFFHWLSREGIDCEVVTPFSSSRLLYYPLFALRKCIDAAMPRLSVWWYRYWHYFFLEKALRSRAYTEQPVVLYAQCPLSARAAIAMKDQNTECRVIMVVHSFGSQADEWELKGRITKGDWVYRGIKSLERSIIPMLDGVVFVSDYARDTYAKALPEVCGIPSIVVPNFCRVPPLPAPHPKRKGIVTIGAIEPVKNHEYLILVLKEACRLGRRYELTIIGQGPDRGRLESLAESHQVRDLVTFTGYVANASRLLPSYRVYAHSAVRENMPFVIIEALAHGLPVLAAAVGGIPEIFTGGVEGEFWPLDDPAEGARILIRLLEDDERYEQMSVAAANRFAAAFDVNAGAANLNSFLQMVGTTQSL